MIITRIDWAGATGRRGAVYLIGWDAEDERPYEEHTGYLVFEKPDGSKVCLPPKKVRVIRAGQVSLEVCDQIARRQVEAGYITMEQYQRAVRSKQ